MNGVICCQAQLLVEIWRDYHEETLCQPVRRRLPEPPDQREMLKAEINFFVQSIQEKARAHGRLVGIFCFVSRAFLIGIIIA